MSAIAIDLESCLRLAEDVAREAAGVILATGRSIEMELDRDRKIRADRVAEELIVERLRSAAPHPVLSEESGLISDDANDAWRWIVDPLDGSVNFSQSIPLCAISIALWKRDEPLLGVIFDFNHDEMYSGLTGSHAALNGKAIAVAAPLGRRESILCTGFPAGADFSEAALLRGVAHLRNYKKLRLLGSAAVSLAYVAAGRAHAYAEDGIRLWDVAAGLALVRAAGGVVRVAGGPDTFSVSAGCCEDVLP